MANPGPAQPPRRLFGKFRGTVLDNTDPSQLGRLQVAVPAATDGVLNWAMPCVPYAGPGVGFYFIPPIGANVWIEFEAGDPDYPIWVGGFWSMGEVPAEAIGSPDTKVIKTHFNSLVLDDTPETGGVRVSSEPPATDDPSTATITPR